MTLMNQNNRHSEFSLTVRQATSIPQMVIYFLFRLFLSHLFKSTATQRCSQHSMDTVSEFHAEASKATASKGLVARVGFEPTTLQTKGAESTNEPPCRLRYYDSNSRRRYI